MTLLFLCIKIFFVRIIDVSLGTVRTVLTVKDKIIKASFIGFFEVLVWFLVVKDALNSDINSLWIAISYALGFATGTYIGGLLARYFNHKETLSIQLIIKKEHRELIDQLRKEGYAVTVIDAMGYQADNKYLLYMEIGIWRFKELKNLIKSFDPNIFMVVNDTRVVYNGYFNGIVK